MLLCLYLLFLAKLTQTVFSGLPGLSGSTKNIQFMVTHCLYDNVKCGMFFSVLPSMADVLFFFFGCSFVDLKPCTVRGHEPLYQLAASLHFLYLAIILYDSASRTMFNQFQEQTVMSVIKSNIFF